jgi:hypothetical protein
MKAKAQGRLGNIVVETFVALDVSSNVSLFAHPSGEAKMFPSKFRNI